MLLGPRGPLEDRYHALKGRKQPKWHWKPPSHILQELVVCPQVKPLALGCVGLAVYGAGTTGVGPLPDLGEVGAAAGVGQADGAALA